MGKGGIVRKIKTGDTETPATICIGHPMANRVETEIKGISRFVNRMLNK